VTLKSVRVLLLQKKLERCPEQSSELKSLDLGALDLIIVVMNQKANLLIVIWTGLTTPRR
jgi:hypothetical protein